MLRNRFSRRSRRFALALLPLAALAALAIASEPEVIDFASPQQVAPGQSFSAGVSVSQAPLSVTFTSNPPGLVSYTTTVNSTSATVSIPTSSSASGSFYRIVATPTAGGDGKSAAILLQVPASPGD